MSDGPSFLTSAPIPTEPVQHGTLQRPAPPYRTPGEVATSRPTVEHVAEPVRRPPPRKAVEWEGPPIGDRAGEHLEMERGKYSAWFYVVFAFGLQCALLGILPRMGLMYVVSEDIATYVALAIGVTFAYLMFRDRWRCNEAFSSRFCSGLMNLSILYVPLVSLVYGNVRGIAKITRRR